MPHATPWYRFVAEAEAFPLSSEASFAWGEATLRRDASFRPAGETGRLAKDFLDDMRPAAYSLSLTAIDALHARVWFNERTDALPMHQYVLGVAEQYIGLEGHCAVLRCPRGETDLAARAARWRWLSLRVPEDLLVAALATHTDDPVRAHHVRLALPGLDRALNEHPVAETHLHLGGAVSSGTLWSALAASLHRSGGAISHRALADAAPPFGSAAGFERMLLAAMIMRLVLAAFLDDEAARRDRSPFDAWLDGYIKQRANLLRGRAHRTPFEERLRRVVSALLRGVRELAPMSLSELRDAYAALLGDEAPGRAWTRRDGGSPSGVADPLDPEGRSANGSTVEGALAVEGLRWLGRHHDTLDGAGLFARCFWQYQRVRGVFHRFLTQEPGTAGLDWFARHYHRIAAFSRRIDPVLPALALRHDAAGLNLAAFEARVAPTDSKWTMRDMVRWFAQGARAIPLERRPEVGLVLHFLREMCASTGALHADPMTAGCRYRSWYQAQRTRVRAIGGLLEACPEMLVVVRGLDVASLELAVPTWAIAPLIREARDLSRKASARLALARPEWDVPPFRVTAHAGEDFRRLSDGLRRVHEFVRFGVVARGDRIGHAIALGFSPELWVRRFGRLAQPRAERLDDLLWELDCYGHDRLPTEVSRVEVVRTEAARLARDIYAPPGSSTPPPSLDALMEVRAMLHGDPGMELLSADGGAPLPPRQRGDARALLERYCCDPGVYSRGVVPIEIETTPSEVAMLTAMQSYLRDLLGRLEITIESNPSSNLLIGNFLDLDEHPAFQLQPLPGREPPGHHPVLLSINTDDPVTFATRLADEYAHIYLAMLRAGVSASDALSWVERLRANAWRSRFTLPLSRRDEALDEILRDTLTA